MISAAFSIDGKYIFSGEYYKGIKQYDLETLKEVQT